MIIILCVVIIIFFLLLGIAYRCSQQQQPNFEPILDLNDNYEYRSFYSPRYNGDV